MSMGWVDLLRLLSAIEIASKELHLSECDQNRTFLTLWVLIIAQLYLSSAIDMAYSPKNLHDFSFGLAWLMGSTDISSRKLRLSAIKIAHF